MKSKKETKAVKLTNDEAYKIKSSEYEGVVEDSMPFMGFGKYPGVRR